MKRCPQCNRIETDEALKFCRVDGATLVDDATVADDSSATRILPGSQTGEQEVHKGQPQVTTSALEAGPQSRPRRPALDAGRTRSDLHRHQGRRLKHLVAAPGRRAAGTVDRLQGRPNLLVRLLARRQAARPLTRHADERRDLDSRLPLKR